MARNDWKAIAHELDLLYARAEALADSLDPRRTMTAKDEEIRIVVRACDSVLKQVSHARTVLRVTGRAA